MAREVDDKEIISLVEGEINGSSDYLDSEISAQQSKAMECARHFNVDDAQPDAHIHRGRQRSTLCP